MSSYIATIAPMTSIDQQLETLGIQLPAPREPAFSYNAVVVDHSIAWVSGQLPWAGGKTELVHTGRLGKAVTLSEGQACARACILNALAALKSALGTLDDIERFLKLAGFVASEPGFNQQPVVIDAASGLLLEIFGDHGQHARSAVGVAELPRGAPVEIELVARTYG